MAKTNGNLRALKMAALATGIIVTVVTAIWTIATRGADLEQMCKEQVIIKVEVKEHDNQLNKHETKIGVLEARQEAIHSGVKRIEAKIDAM